MRRSVASLFFLLVALCAFGTQEQEPFSEKKWEQLTRNLDYSKSPESNKRHDQQSTGEYDGNGGEYYNDDNGSREYPDRGNTGPSGAGTLFQGAGLVFTIIVIVLLLLLIVFMIVNSKSNPNLAAQNASLQEIENIEEKIHDVDLDALFDQFARAEEYHTALRMSFLMIIKQLSEKRLIKWEKQKTNWEYHSELDDYNLRTGFGGMIQTFERFWYGEKVLSDQEFQQTESEFAIFKNRLDEQS